MEWAREFRKRGTAIDQWWAPSMLDSVVILASNLIRPMLCSELATAMSHRRQQIHNGAHLVSGTTKNEGSQHDMESAEGSPAADGSCVR